MLASKNKLLELLQDKKREVRMPFKVVVPKLGRESISVKDMVISILGREWPLNINKLHSSIKKDFSKDVTYQAVYKSVRSLHDEKILEKKDRDYKLSCGWIDDTKRYLEYLWKLQSGDKGFIEDAMSGLIPDKEIEIREFKHIKQLYNFIRKFEKENVLKDKDIKDHTFYVIADHCYNQLFMPSVEFHYVKKLKKKGVDVKILCNGNTKLDISSKKFFEKSGAEMKVGVNCCNSRYINLYHNIMIEIFFSRKFNEILEEVYRSSESIHDVDIAEILNMVYEDDSKVKAVITRDKRIINSIKNNIIKPYFDCV